MKNLIKLLLQYSKAKYLQTRRISSRICLNLRKPICVKKFGKKRVLISYITNPFKTQGDSSHSNQKEVITMANVLSELGYAVDVVDYNSEFSINYYPYDLLIGFGTAFSRSFSVLNFQGKRILHLTGASPNFSNEAEARRCHSLKQRKGVTLPPKREVYWPWVFSAVNADAIFVLGNHWTLSTYNNLNSNMKILPVPYVSSMNERSIKRDYSKIRNNYCWFGGFGAVHKGLDLILEVFEKIDRRFHLDVCGSVDQEEDFLSIYRDSLTSNPNVTFHGFVDVKSRKMELIMANNTFVIFPSCSEGGGSSVITCMASGLIPVVTKEASVEIHDFGILIENDTVSSIQQTMYICDLIENEELEIRSKKSAHYASSEHSYETYGKALKNAILNIDTNTETQLS